MPEPFHKRVYDQDGDYASICWLPRLENSIMLEAHRPDLSEEGSTCVQLLFTADEARKFAQDLIEAASVADNWDKI